MACLQRKKMKKYSAQILKKFLVLVHKNNNTPSPKEQINSTYSVRQSLSSVHGSDSFEIRAHSITRLGISVDIRLFLSVLSICQLSFVLAIGRVFCGVLGRSPCLLDHQNCYTSSLGKVWGWHLRSPGIIWLSNLKNDLFPIIKIKYTLKYMCIFYHTFT